MSFPNPPVPDQEYTHSNGITYIYSASKKAWEIKYEAATNTALLPLANPTRYLPPAGASLPDTGGLLTQSHYNEWAFNSLIKVDETSRVDAGETAPGDADTNQLWYKPSTGSLYVYYNDGSSTQWVEIGGGSGGDFVTNQDFIADQERQDSRVDELSGEVIIKRDYTLTVGGSEVAGELNVDSSTWGAATFFIFGTTDLGNLQTPTMNVGDVIRVADLGETSINEFQITMVSHPNYRVNPLTNIGAVGSGFPGRVSFIRRSAQSLSARVTDGEAKQATIEATVNTALGVQADIQADQITQNESIGSIEDEQIVQNSQINALETQIQLLAQTQAVGKWTYRRNIEGTLRPPQSATFYGTDIDNPTNNVLNDWSKLQLIMVDKTDIDGTTYTFADFEEGDKLEILAADGSSACFGTVTNNPNVDGYGNLVIAVERSNGGPVEEATYLLSVYRPGANTGDVDLDILDGRYVVKTGDTLTGNLILDGGGLYTDSIIKSTRDTGYAFQVKPDDGDATSFIHTNGNAEFANVKVEAAPTNGADLANKDYLDNNFLPLTGGTLTGDLAMSGNKVTGMGTPTADGQAANKGYVDGKIAAIDAGVQETDRIIAKPSRWTYRPDLEAENLTKGTFRINDSKTRLYLSQYNEWGNTWYVAESSEYVWNFSSHLITTITDYAGSIKVQAKFSSITYNAGGNGYVRFALETQKTKVMPFANSRYLINIPGMLPMWQYEPFSEYGNPTI